MASSLDIDNKKMQSVGVAAAAVGYSRDYVTKLARDQKITAFQINRQWFVDVHSLELYVAQSLAEQKIKQQQLSEIRKAERMIAVQKESTDKVTSSFLSCFAKQKSSVAMMALLGLTSAYSLVHFSPSSNVGFSSAQVVSTAEINTFEHDGTAYEITIGTNLSASEPIPLEVDFSQESVRLSDIKKFAHGVLLLPYATSTSNVKLESLFSDAVKIQTDEFGHEYVVIVDKNNEIVSQIPFVAVPVVGN